MAAGAAGAVIAYGLITTCVAAVLQVLGEMTIAFPVSGNFIDYADRFVDPSIAFAAGFAEWLGTACLLPTCTERETHDDFQDGVQSWARRPPSSAW